MTRRSTALTAGWLGSIALAAACVAPVPSPPATAGPSSPASNPAEPSAPAVASVAIPSPVELGGPLTGLPEAVLSVPLTPHVGPAPDGPPFLEQGFPAVPAVIAAGRTVVVLGDAVPGPDSLWVRVFVPTDDESYLGDFFAWLPVTDHGAPALAARPGPACPEVATIEALAPLLQPHRARCVGGASIVLTARTWHAGAVPPYDTTPAWFGTNARQDSIVSLFSPGPSVIGPGDARRPFQAAGWIDARLPPTVERPPLDMVVAVSGHFNDPAAETCSRVQAVGFEAPPGEGFPAEAAADSAAWCREQFVVEGWQVVTGPEGRPIDPLAPQLHRLAIPAGQPFACAGVGMGPLTIRIDVSRPDPVWIESGGRTDIVPVFGPEFALINGLQIVGPGGVTLSDGEVVDPDRGKPGIGVCPTGDAVSFVVVRG